MSFNFKTLYRRDINENYFLSHSLTSNLNVHSTGFFGKTISLIRRESEDQIQLAENVLNYIKSNHANLILTPTTNLNLAIKNLEIINSKFYCNESASITSAISKLKTISTEREQVKAQLSSHYGHDDAFAILDSIRAQEIADEANIQQKLHTIGNNYSFDHLSKIIGKANIDKYLEEFYSDAQVRHKFKTGQLIFGESERVKLITYHKYRNEFISMQRGLEHLYGKKLTQSILDLSFKEENNPFNSKDVKTFRKRIHIIASLAHYESFKAKFSNEITEVFKYRKGDQGAFESSLKQGEFSFTRSMKRTIKHEYLLSVEKTLIQNYGNSAVSDLLNNEKKLNYLLRVRNSTDFAKVLDRNLLGHCKQTPE